MQHYRCFRYYIASTNGERIAETVEFVPQVVKMPSTSSHDPAIKATNDLIYALKHPTSASPTLILGDPRLRVFEKLAGIFNSSIQQPSPLESTSITPAQSRVENIVLEQLIPTQSRVDNKVIETPLLPRMVAMNTETLPPPPPKHQTTIQQSFSKNSTPPSPSVIIPPTASIILPPPIKPPSIIHLSYTKPKVSSKHITVIYYNKYQNHASFFHVASKLDNNVLGNLHEDESPIESTKLYNISLKILDKELTAGIFYY